METKICGKCKQGKELSEFYQHKRDGYQSICKACKRELGRVYNKTPHRKEYNRQKYQEWVDKGGLQEYKQRPEIKEKVLAIAKANQKKRSGKIIPQPCEVCGVDDAQMHHNDYSKPLAIRWLCQLHHTQEHLKIRKAEGKDG